MESNVFCAFTASNFKQERSDQMECAKMAGFHSVGHILLYSEYYLQQQAS